MVEFHYQIYPMIARVLCIIASKSSNKGYKVETTLRRRPVPIIFDFDFISQGLKLAVAVVATCLFSIKVLSHELSFTL